MWNSSIRPVMDADMILETRRSRGSDFPEGAEQSLITDFLYNGDLTVDIGQPLFCTLHPDMVANVTAD